MKRRKQTSRLARVAGACACLCVLWEHDVCTDRATTSLDFETKAGRVRVPLCERCRDEIIARGGGIVD